MTNSTLTERIDHLGKALPQLKQRLLPIDYEVMQDAYNLLTGRVFEGVTRTFPIDQILEIVRGQVGYLERNKGSYRGKSEMIDQAISMLTDIGNVNIT